ncbi:hypothetical protein [Methylobacterium sp. E-066]|uniref:hypothetical protein n=1 Tax=Methylobacterium sp. E-066 TaxID=2836584 RepID=UPI001FB871A2|nr:hypothetical protein [Methylobacterium sp. E-066]MCJ2138448.1 hypothetical protein [Methylobacterium sp. E-066]
MIDVAAELGIELGAGKPHRACSEIRFGAETVLAAQRHRFGLFMRTVGPTRVWAAIRRSNLADNIKCFL